MAEKMTKENTEKNTEENVDIDDFLNLDEEVFPVQEESVVESEPVVPEPQPETSVAFSKELEGDLPKLCGEGYPQGYLDMVERAYATYRMLPKLNYSMLYRELSDLSVTSSPTPTLQVLNDEIQKVQSAKDRLSEIMVKVLECHNIKKRLLDTLITS